MAIQIRRGTNTEWESNNSNIVVGEPAIATDEERFFVGTDSGAFAEFANLDIIAPAYDTSTSYEVGDVINRQGKLYSCNTPCSGAFNIGYWNETSLTDILKDLANEIDYAQYEIGYADGKLITIDNGASEIPVKDLKFDIKAVQSGSGDPSPTNIRPISGWTGANIYDDSIYGGKINWNQLIQNGNFENDSTTGWTGGTYVSLTASNGVMTVSSTTSSNRQWQVSANAAILAGHKYLILGGFRRDYDGTDGDARNHRIVFVGEESNVVYTFATQTVGDYRLDTIVAPVNNATQFLFSTNGSVTSGGARAFYSVWDVMLIDITQMFGAEKADEIYTMEQAEAGAGVAYFRSIFKKNYYAYNTGTETLASEIEGTPYWIENISWQTEAGTVYGGTLDATTGVLTVTHRYLEVSSCNSVGTASTDVQYANIGLGSGNGANSDHSTNISSSYEQTENAPQTDGYFRLSGSTLYIYNNKFTDKATADAILASEMPQVVYKLATPQVVQLTPTQVRTVLGTNNLWNQMNSNNELAYRISNALN